MKWLKSFSAIESRTHKPLILLHHPNYHILPSSLTSFNLSSKCKYDFSVAGMGYDCKPRNSHARKTRHILTQPPPHTVLLKGKADDSHFLPSALSGARITLRIKHNSQSPSQTLLQHQCYTLPKHTPHSCPASLLTQEAARFALLSLGPGTHWFLHDKPWKPHPTS